MIYLADNNQEGHHRLYYEELLKIPQTTLLMIAKSFATRKHLFRYFLDRTGFIRQCVRKVIKDQSEPGVLHFLDVDNLYLAGSFLPSLKNKLKIMGTLHHLPSGRNLFFLKRFVRKHLEMVVVHSEYIREKLVQSGIHPVEVADYPVFHPVASADRDLLRSSAGIPRTTVITGLLGGTRQDKGLDIFLKSLQYLSVNDKSRLFLLIAGKPESFSEEWIRSQLEPLGIGYKTDLRYLNDQEFADYMTLCDLIVLPYRKNFNGNSGPLAEAVFRNIPALGTDAGNIGYLIRHNRLGRTFRSEDPENLAENLLELLNHPFVPDEVTRQYRQKLDTGVFRNSYELIYRKTGAFQ